MHGIIQHDARRHQQLGEPERVNALLAVPTEIDPALPQEIDGVAGIGVIFEVEFAEIELPDAAAAGAAIGEVAEGIREGEPELDELEHVDVGLEGGVVVIGARFEGPQRPADDPGELGVHGDEGVIVDDLADQGELRFEVVAPDLADLDGVVGFGRGRHGSMKSNRSETETLDSGESTRPAGSRAREGGSGDLVQSKKKRRKRERKFWELREIIEKREVLGKKGTKMISASHH